ncbi:MAG: prephenate dehydratase [bacterium]
MNKAPSYRAAYQGIDGAYSQEAIFRYFSEKVPTCGCANFEDVVAKVESGEAEFGFMPAENSIAGTIVQTYDLLLESTLSIIGEFYLPIHHNLMILPETNLDKVETVYSHPQALAQCAQSIRRFGLRPEAAWDTAGSAKKLREEALHNAAAIAGKQAAESYKLKCVASNIEDLDHNTTRFFILGKQAAKPGPQNKTSILFTTRHAPGELLAALKEFSDRKINLTKIESRPDRRHPWHYIFYLDVEGYLEDSPLEAAMFQLLKRARMVKILGSYPRGDQNGGE